MSEMNLNLLPSKARFQAAKIRMRQMVKRIILIMVVIWMSTFLLLWLLNLYTDFRVSAATKQLDKAKNNYLSLSDNILTSQKLKYKAKVVGGVLDNRFEYGKAFETVSTFFPTGVLLVNFDLRKDGTFLIDGTTSNKENMDLVEKIILDTNSGKSTAINSAKLTSLSMVGSIWKFTMEVVLK